MLGILVIGLLLIGRFYPGSGADVLDWKPTRSPEVEAQNEIDDIEQMLAAQNERRRRKGLPERTEEQVQADVDASRREIAERGDKLRAERDAASLEGEIEHALAHTNARRRRKGLPELTPEEYRAKLDDPG